MEKKMKCLYGSIVETLKFEFVNYQIWFDHFFFFFMFGFITILDKNS